MCLSGEREREREREREDSSTRDIDRTHVSLSFLIASADVQTTVPGHIPISEQFINGYTTWAGIPNAGCAQANPTQVWNCYFSPFTYPCIPFRILFVSL